jgi:hypothetical protein
LTKSSGSYPFPITCLAAVLAVGLVYLFFVRQWWDEGALLDPNYGCTIVRPLDDLGDPDGLLVFRKCWWQQDGVSNFIYSGYVNLFVPAWNGFISIGQNRTTLGWLVSLLYLAAVGATFKLFFDWLNERSK